ncbi:hypothetical protein [Mycolicibacterium gilvum]|uniref:hypothetical protein n=1 Tax=Mycolicibacterium gilvum TaxID=1804 RepID=UPI001C1E7279|nr:hypothetical protein [Mycolicibacterium gilvum]
MTDGLENASHEWSRPAIKSLVEQQTNEFGWEYLYMGADQDADEVGKDLGVKAEQAVTYSRGKSGKRWRPCRATCGGIGPRRALMPRQLCRRSPRISGPT